MFNEVYEPDEVWSVFLSMTGQIGKSKLIAYDDAYKVDVYMVPRVCRDFGDDNVLPYIEVYYEDYLQFNEVCISNKDCEDTVKEIYEMVMDDIGDDQDPVGYGEDSFAETIKNREDELLCATKDYLGIIVNTGENFKKYCTDAVVEELMNKFLAFAAKENIPVYRPAMLTDEDGSMIYTEFPYELMQ